jgi:2-keto-4-pentenoate hydratase
MFRGRPVPFDPEPAAGVLHTARRQRHALDQLPAAIRPGTIDEGYAVQEALARRLGESAGWKIAFTSQRLQAAVGLHEPIAGRLPARGVLDSPARAEGHRVVMVEAEYAVRFGARFAPDPNPDPAAVSAAIAQVAAAVEVVDPIFADRDTAGLPSLVAGGVAAALVLGQPVGWHSRIDRVETDVVVEVDGVAIARGSGAAVMGDPMVALLWLIAHLGRRGICVEAGQVVATGSCTGLTPVPFGSKVRALYGGLPAVEFTVPDLAR